MSAVNELLGQQVAQKVLENLYASVFVVRFFGNLTSEK